MTLPDGSTQQIRVPAGIMKAVFGGRIVELPAKPIVKVPKKGDAKVLNDSLGKEVKEVNRIIGLSRVENAVIYLNGKQVLLRQGNDTTIKFTKAEMKMMKGALVTHNHPYGTSFSRADVLMVRQNGIKELQAVSTREGLLYRMNPPKDAKFWKTDMETIFADHELFRAAIYKTYGYEGENISNAPTEVHAAAINQSIKALDLKYQLGYTIENL